MKAAFKVGKERFEVREVATPSVGPRECLVRIHYCATCVWCYKEWLRDGTDDIFGPGVTGHEIAGVVEVVGPQVKEWKVGDRVLTYFSGHCETCPECLAGKTTYCMTPTRPKDVIGGYAEYVSAAEQCLLPAPDGIDLKYSGVIPDMVGTSMHAIRRAFSVDLPRKNVTVWGLGPVGLFMVQGLRCFDGVERVVAFDPVASRREMALELGADEALDPFAEGVEAQLKAENGGRGFDYAFNCALPSPDMAYRTLRKDGYLMSITGGVPTESQLEKRVDGSFYFFKNEYAENVRLVQEGKIKLDPTVSHEFALDDINAAMELRAKHHAESLKVTIRCL